MADCRLGSRLVRRKCCLFRLLKTLPKKAALTGHISFDRAGIDKLPAWQSSFRYLGRLRVGAPILRYFESIPRAQRMHEGPWSGWHRPAACRSCFGRKSGAQVRIFAVLRTGKILTIFRRCPFEGYSFEWQVPHQVKRRIPMLLCRMRNDSACGFAALGCKRAPMLRKTDKICTQGRFFLPNRR